MRRASALLRGLGAAATVTFAPRPAPGMADASPGATVLAGASVPAAEIDLSILPPDRRTRWRPGIPGGVPHYGMVQITVDVGTFGGGTADATAAVSDAVQAACRLGTAGSPRVVYLPAGVYGITGTVVIDCSYVVLRGAGKGKTIIRMAASGRPALALGRIRPYTGLVNVVGSVPKGATRLTVADARNIDPGDVLQIDQVEDGNVLGTKGWVWRFDTQWFMRGPRGHEDTSGPDSPTGFRPIGQQVEIASRSGNVLTLANTIHIDFAASQVPQVFHTATAREGQPGIRYSGIEDLTAQ